MQPHTAKTPCYNITMIFLGKISMEIITLLYSDRLTITTLTDPLKGTDLLKGCLNVQLLSCAKYSVFVIYTKSDRYCLKDSNTIHARKYDHALYQKYELSSLVITV